MNKNFKNLNTWVYLIIIGILSSYLYIFAEWIFFITKPSFMSNLENTAKISLFFISGGILALSTFFLILIFLLLNLLFTFPRSSRFLESVTILIPSSILAALELILIDNFTYIVFKFGIIISHGMFRAIYILIFCVLFVYSYKQCVSFIKACGRSSVYLKTVMALTFILLVVTFLFINKSINFSTLGNVFNNAEQREKLPNILIIGSDGVNASNMSVYGYDRDTTPYLRELATSSLLAENAFSNAGNTTGSITSILTSKLPTQTRVLYSPNILTGVDAYQHLPGILHGLGYFTVEIGVTKYVDAYDVNMQDGFDLVNQRSIDDSGFSRLIRKIGFGESSYFLSRISERIIERILHIFFIKTMNDPYTSVSKPDENTSVSDSDRINQVFNLLDNINGPLFIHVHLMGTHGPMFFPQKQIFSAGEEQYNKWMTDFYDDAILDFDGYVRKVIDHLLSSGKLDNTIVVIYTDHNMRNKTSQRIPLIIRFPRGEHAGRISNNIQNLDIAPTILDYIGVPIPTWMDGWTLLKNPPSTNRFIFSANVGIVDPQSGDIDAQFLRPPFYQFGSIGVVVCDKWYRYITQEDILLAGVINNYTAPCKNENVPSVVTVKPKLIKHLQEMSFNIRKISGPTYSVFWDTELTRAQVVRVIQELSYTPRPTSDVFLDLVVSDQYTPWVECFYSGGIGEMSLMSPMKYCPNELISRGETAKLVLLAKEGSSYTPSPATFFIVDVPIDSPYSAWIEDLRNRINASSNNLISNRPFRPNENITEVELLIWLIRIFNNP